MDAGTPEETVRETANTLIEDLGLIDCRDTFIGGDAMRGVSGGERKRCSIGVELVTDPMLLFLGKSLSNAVM